MIGFTNNQPSAPPQAVSPPATGRGSLLSFISNVMTSRAGWLKTLLDMGKRDLYHECGYPKGLTKDEYRSMWEREGLAQKVVDLFPNHCWAIDPDVFDNDDEGVETAFEKAYKKLVEQQNLLHYLHRIDVRSGISFFGLLLYGLDDGLDLEQPVAGFETAYDPTEPLKLIGSERKLRFLRTFDESLVSIDTWDTDEKSFRFGQPEFYTIQFYDLKSDNPTEGTGQLRNSRKVHWSRVEHIADNCGSSEVYGTPRMQSVYNRLMDVRKILSSSGEMFWKGGFPGFAFEVNPELGDVQLDKEEMRKEFENYSEGLQRYLAVTGVTTKSLSPQVSDPNGHLMAQLQYIALTLGVPMRMLIGTEAAQLASGQDTANWHRKIKYRQEKYVEPKVLRKVLDKLIRFGVLPVPENGEYVAKFPDIDNQSATEKAAIALQKTQALVAYANSSAPQTMPPLEYLTHVWDMEKDEAEAILEAAEEYSAEVQAQEAKQMEAQAKLQQGMAIDTAKQMSKIPPPPPNPAAKRLPPPPTKNAGFDPNQPRDYHGRWGEGGGGRVDSPATTEENPTAVKDSDVLYDDGTWTVSIQGNLEDTLDTMENLDLTAEDLIDLTGTISGKMDMVVGSLDERTLLINVEHDKYDAIRVIREGRIENESFFVNTKEKDKGIGTSVLSRQVRAAIRHGFERIDTYGIRADNPDPDFASNGYYTWARLGYDAPIYGNDSNAPAGLDVRELQARFDKTGGKLMLSDLMASQEGRDWWREHGWSKNMTFDLSKGSLSRHVLNAYVRENPDKGGVTNRKPNG